MLGLKGKGREGEGKGQGQGQIDRCHPSLRDEPGGLPAFIPLSLYPFIPLSLYPLPACLPAQKDRISSTCALETAKTVSDIWWMYTSQGK